MRSYRSVGYKHAKWHDVGWWQLELQDRDPSPEPPRLPSDLLDTPGWEQALHSGEAWVRE